MKIIITLMLLPAIAFGQPTFNDDVQDVPNYHKMILKPVRVKKYIPSLIFTAISGAADGLRDASIFYHIKNGGYFDGRDSWKNKYKNGDYRQGAAYFGSTSFLAWTTDGAHLMSTVSHQSDAWAQVMMPTDNNKRFSHLLLKVAAITATRSLSHFLVYDVIIKNKNR